ncbi:neuraminidase-like domain-containing protein [Amycolatopsis pithecellobii]|uniref:Uncharacterized protein n=1 Tax=Amycolatopsis pithecellobii TaxID=664692 RepID=A0A6N7YQG0_9PSEU|nr:neuraminidase-like domain-containing protein [Amycolatopsis pithecellobii]MTD55247.1 hypothetical protein [Amycolatopsis pithecellobii]
MTSSDQPGQFTVDGQVVCAVPAALAELFVEIVDRNVGGDTDLGSARTDGLGRFRVTFSHRGKAQPDLQARVRTQEGGAVIGESDVHYNATSGETLVVELPAGSGPASEFDTLTGALRATFTGPLAEVEESGARQDITYLAGKTGWDARAIAMRVLADQFSVDSGGTIPPPLYYALFRAGLPADPATLYRAHPDSAERAWRTAIEQGVIPGLLEAQLAQARDSFSSLSAENTLALRAVPGTSSLAELLDLTFPGDQQAKSTFARLYDLHRQDPVSLWEHVEETFGRPATDDLRLSGQLAALTLNNAPLVRALRAAEESASSGGLTDPLELARRGYFRAERWRELLSGSIPEQVRGTTPEQREAQYAELMAAQVRLSFPTAVVATRIADGDLLAATPPPLRAAVHEFLTTNLGRFELGVEPVERFLDRNPEARARTDTDAVREIKRVQRVYQLTPHDEAMPVLLDHGLDSAFTIAGHDEQAFVEARAADLGPDVALAVHRRSRQISNAVSNIATSFLTSRMAPTLGVRKDAPILGLVSDPSPDPASRTLAGLFGALDHDACEQCESVLSPAAYLVDLLHFLDRPNGSASPLDTLLSRRPDLAHLPLTCENTNTAVPHIDLVNETLEYFVAHGFSLSGYEGHDTATGADSAELLADPRFVDESAYRTLAGEFFPPPLPFHRALERSRRLFDQLGIPLREAMITLRQHEGVERDGHSYGWRDIMMEELGLSRAEHGVLTDGTITLQQLLGFPPTSTDVVAAMSVVRTFSARLGVSYADIVELLRTQVLNPGGASSIVLTSAGDDVPFEDLELRRVDSSGTRKPVTPTDLVRIVRFVRLWRKLGWTIAQTDAALVAVHPAAGAVDPATGPDEGWRTALLRLGVVHSVLRRLALNPDTDLLSLLACWAPIGTHGPSSLYRSLFSRAGQEDPAFGADGLAGPASPLLAHEPALCAAFGLTAEDFALITDALGFDAATPLTLDNLSAVYRRGWLARALGLSPREFLTITRLTGLDPFAPPEPPRPAVLSLLDLLDSLRATGLTPSAAADLFWPREPDETMAFDLARALRSSLGAVESQFAIDDGPAGERTQDLLALVYGTAAAEAFTGLLTGSLAVSVPYTHPVPELDPAILDAAGARIAYDPAEKTLSYSGPLTAVRRDALIALSISPEFAAAVGNLFRASEDRKVRDTVFGGSDFTIESLLTDQPGLRALLKTYAGSAAAPGEKLRNLLADILPKVKTERERRVALADVVTATRADPATAEALLLDAEVLGAAADPESAAIESLTALRAGGLDIVSTGPGIVQASGFLEVPESGPYRIGVDVDSPATVTITVDGTELETEQRGSRHQSAVSLEAGRLIPVTFRVAGAAESPQWTWRAGDRPWEVIPDTRLYRSTLVTGLRTVLACFRAALAIGEAVRFGADELTYLTKNPDLRIDGAGWLNALPVPAGETDGLRAVLLAALDLAAVESAFPGGRGVPPVLRDPGGALPEGWQPGPVHELLAWFGQTADDLGHLDVLHRVQEAYALLSLLGIPVASLTGATTNDPGSAAVQALQVALRSRGAGRLDILRAANDPVRQLSRDALVAFILREMRNNPATAHIDTADKLFETFLMDVRMEPCAQTSRIRHAISAVQLFVDRVLMNLEDPAVPPSAVNAEHWAWMKRYRIWEANRQVYLWPENWLEPELRDDQSPFFREAMSELLQSDITEDTAATALLNYLSKLEEVAKLEPCGIHYVEGEPVRGDEVAHVVARTPGAQRRYYYRRREFGTWSPWERIDLDIEDNPIKPVVWRGRLLLFWLRIINDGVPPHPAPGVETTELTRLTLQQLRGGEAGEVKVNPQAVLCWSEYYNGRWQPPKTSNVRAPTSFGQTFKSTGEGAFDRDMLVLGETTESDALRVRIRGKDNGASFESSFLLFNTHSLPQRREDRRDDPPDIENFAHLIRDIKRVDDTLTVDYRTESTLTSRNVISWREDGPLRITAPFHVAYFSDELQQSLLRNPWEAPFFFEDTRHTFYVTTDRPHRTPMDDDGFGLPPSFIEPVEIPPLTTNLPALPDSPAITARLDTPDPVVFNGFDITPGGRSRERARDHD